MKHISKIDLQALAKHPRKTEASVVKNGTKENILKVIIRGSAMHNEGKTKNTLRQIVPIENNYKPFASGGYDRICLAKDTSNGEIVVVKSVATPTMIHQRDLNAEVSLHERVVHPNIVELTSREQKLDHSLLVLEHMEGG